MSPARSGEAVARDVLAFPFPNTPEARRAVSGLRKQVRDEIKRLVAFLDATDADTDMEDGGDTEPWLGWAVSGALGGGDDREDDDEREPACEDEGADDERERDPAEMGVGDRDGLAEQVSHPCDAVL